MSATPYKSVYWHYLREFKRHLLRKALREHGGNVCRAAASVGLHRNTFWTAMRKLGIDPGEYRRAA